MSIWGSKAVGDPDARECSGCQAPKVKVTRVATPVLLCLRCDSKGSLGPPVVLDLLAQGGAE